MMMRTISCFSSVVDNNGNTSEKPTIALSGVRISCVILARKTLLFWPDSLARSVSRFSSSCFCSISVTLRKTPKLPSN